MYRPQRVAMQFGMDQDLPANSRAPNLALDRMVFFVPPRSSLAGVSERYFDRWKDFMSARECEIKDILLQIENVTKHKESTSDDTKLTGKDGFDWHNEAAVKYKTAYSLTGEGKAGSSVGDPTIITGEWETIKRSRDSRKPSTGFATERSKDDPKRPKRNEVTGAS